MAKKSKSVIIEPTEIKASIPNLADPPKTERDILTGKYTKNKKQALEEWFRAAKSTSSGSYEWKLDAKQAIYEPKSKRKKK